MASVHCAPTTWLGPADVTPMLNAGRLPTRTSVGPRMNGDRSACGAATVTVLVEVLLATSGSGPDVVTTAVFVMAMPATVVDGTPTTTVKDSAVAPGGSADVLAAVMVPVPPTAGVVRVHPAGDVALTNVVPAGTASLSCTEAALAVPMLSTAIV